ncbi:hypothetical protein LEM8419_03358 [Neolewinella maritima]|uniref:DUF481 domain-containing protein n=1 Tax=Neolewinella maritima TaxID=1383882 RepID=A0ABM9B514_9BACT|nr:hypothetical protein [Neolewinella maritima]CAH1002479.1 hypothetical protein LEM8419_03358 [Neolewinella maritima]
MKILPVASCLVLLLMVVTSAYGQTRLNLFTDCECNKTLLKQELNYVNHTIDPVNAQVNLFIVTNYLSNGGRVYDLQFKGQQQLAENSLSFKVSTTAVMTSLERDEYLNKRIELGLAGFLAGTTYADLVDLTAQAPPEPEVSEEEADGSGSGGGSSDGWNNWIFETSASFFTSKESQRSKTQVRLGFEADRTTPDWRLRFSPNFFYRIEKINQSQGEPITSVRRDQWFDGKVVKSISNHWSVGILGSANSSTYRNIDLGIFLAPAIEYNIFDYNQVPFKEFTVAYRMGWVRNTYTDTTVFFQTQESLVRQSLDIDLRLRQRWGQVFAGISAANYMDDFSKNRLSLDARADVRIIKGLSFNIGGSYDIINDQISLPAREISEQDRLLGITQLATSYSADISVGFSYTFGSLFNNVINTRL